MIVLFLITILVLMLTVNWFRLLIERHRMNINGPIPLPLLGSAHLFLVKSTEFLHLIQNKMIDKYGDAIMAHIFTQPVVLLNHPKYIEPLITSMDYITKGSLYDYFTCWLGQGLLTSTGQRWKSHRKFLTPAFHFNMLQNFLPVFCKNQRVFVDKMRKLADGRPIDIFPHVALAALDNVTESIMGVCVDAQKHEESKYVKAIEEMTAILSMRMQIPILGADVIFNLLPYKTRQDKALKILHDQTRKVIKARSEELRKSKISNRDFINGIGIKNQHAFLDLLLLAESDGKKIDAQSVQEEVDTFMFEGHDTVTSGVSFSLFCLSKRRDVQEKIYEELKTIFIDDMSRDPTYHELHQMKYLELVLKESMRLYPSVPFIQRLMVKDCEIGALKLVKDTSVIIDIYHMQRHPELYEDPLEFRPERFETPLKNPFNWLAFSAGPRNCIGQKFAMMELKVMISEMVKNFVILPSDVEPELCADLTLRSKNGIHVKLVHRQNSMTNTAI